MSKENYGTAARYIAKTIANFDKSTVERDVLRQIGQRVANGTYYAQIRWQSLDSVGEALSVEDKARIIRTCREWGFRVEEIVHHHYRFSGFEVFWREE